MKFAVLVLLLANLVLFGWLRWAQPGAPTTTLELVPPATGGTPLKIVPPGTAVIAKAMPRPPAARRCLTVGPLTGVAPAAALAARLGESGLAARTLVRAAKVPGDYQVLIVGFTALRAAERTATKLRRAGMRDLAVVKMQPAGYELSLGLFADIDHARMRVVEAKKLGLQPQILVHAHTASLWFLELPASTSAAAVVRAAGVGLKIGICAGAMRATASATGSAASARAKLALPTRISAPPSAPASGRP